MDLSRVDKENEWAEVERICRVRQPHLLPVDAKEVADTEAFDLESFPFDPSDSMEIEGLWQEGCGLLLLFDPPGSLIAWVCEEVMRCRDRMVVFILRDRGRLLRVIRSAWERGWLDKPGIYWADGEFLGLHLQEIFLRNSLILYRPDWVRHYISVEADPSAWGHLDRESEIFSSWFVEQREAHNRRFAGMRDRMKGTVRVWGYVLSGPGVYIHGPMLAALGRGLREAGMEAEVCSVESRDPAISCRLLDSLTRYSPTVFLCLNAPIGESYGRFLNPEEAAGLPQTRLVWLVDHPRFTMYGKFDGRDVVWVSDDSYSEVVRSMGAEKIFTAPPAADLDGPGRVREELRCPVAFVGIYHDTQSFLDAFAPWTRDLVEELVEQMLSGRDPLAKHGFLEDAPPEDVERSRPVFEEFCRRLGKLFGDDETMLLFVASVTASSRKRAEAVRVLIPYGMRVYGNEAWFSVLGEKSGECFRGQGHRDDLADIYASVEVNINCHSPQLPRGLNVRDFNIPMAGGCLLTDGVADMERGILNPGEHLAVFRDVTDLQQKVEWLLRSPGERERLAQAGRDEVLRHHLYRHRAERLKACLQS